MARRITAVAIPGPSLSPQDPEQAAITAAWSLYDQGRDVLATDQMLQILETRGAAGDRAAALCALLLAHHPTPGRQDSGADRVLSASMAQLIAVVEQQDSQIAALLALLGE